MTTPSRAIIAAAQLGVMVVAMTACVTSSSYLSPTESNTTLMAGWEQHFTLEWTAEPEPGNARRLTGYIYNRHGEPATAVRVLAQALDPAGAVLGQRIEWVPEGVNGFGRTYFLVPHLPAANTYRVTIWDYTFRHDEPR
jgi:hypothetical protein